MAELTAVVHVIARVGQAEAVKSELLKLAAAVRAEEGCLQYDLHQGIDNPSHFTFVERWENMDVFQAHADGANVKEFLMSTGGLLSSFMIHKMTSIA